MWSLIQYYVLFGWLIEMMKAYEAERRRVWLEAKAYRRWYDENVAFSPKPGFVRVRYTFSVRCGRRDFRYSEDGWWDVGQTVKPFLNVPFSLPDRVSAPHQEQDSVWPPRMVSAGGPETREVWVREEALPEYWKRYRPGPGSHQVTPDMILFESLGGPYPEHLGMCCKKAVGLINVTVESPAVPERLTSTNVQAGA